MRYKNTDAVAIKEEGATKMPNEFNLRKCPFCGSADAELYDFDPFDGYQGDCARWIVRCRFCGAAVERINKEKAIDAWNRRANDEQAD